MITNYLHYIRTMYYGKDDNVREIISNDLMLREKLQLDQP